MGTLCPSSLTEETEVSEVKRAAWGRGIQTVGREPGDPLRGPESRLRSPNSAAPKKGLIKIPEELASTSGGVPDISPTHIKITIQGQACDDNPNCTELILEARR